MLTKFTIENIIKTETEDKVIILGKQENPYPYIANCDIYVQPSRYEGKSVTVREAQILCKPVVVTNFSTVNDQFKNGYNASICEMNGEAIANSIIELCTNR